MFTVIVSIMGTLNDEWSRIKNYERGSYSDYAMAAAHRHNVYMEYALKGWSFDYVSNIDSYVSENRDGKIIIIGIRDPLK